MCLPACLPACATRLELRTSILHRHPTPMGTSAQLEVLVLWNIACHLGGTDDAHLGPIGHQPSTDVLRVRRRRGNIIVYQMLASEVRLATLWHAHTCPSVWAGGFAYATTCLECGFLQTAMRTA